VFDWKHTFIIVLRVNITEYKIAVCIRSPESRAIQHHRRIRRAAKRATVGFVMSACQPVRVKQHVSQWTDFCDTVVPPYPLIHYPRFTMARKQNYINKRFISFKTRAKRERVVTWLNPAAHMRPILDSSSFVPALTLHHRTCLQSASSVLTVHISCGIITVFVFRKPLFIN
jgi:hypothetical protein